MGIMVVLVQEVVILLILVQLEVLTILLIKDILKRHKSCFIDEHDIFNLHDGVRECKLRSFSVILQHALEVNQISFCFLLCFDILSHRFGEH